MGKRGRKRGGGYQKPIAVATRSSQRNLSKLRGNTKKTLDQPAESESSSEVQTMAEHKNECKDVAVNVRKIHKKFGKYRYLVENEPSTDAVVLQNALIQNCDSSNSDNISVNKSEINMCSEIEVEVNTCSRTDSKSSEINVYSVIGNSDSEVQINNEENSSESENVNIVKLDLLNGGTDFYQEIIMEDSDIGGEYVIQNVEMDDYDSTEEVAVFKILEETSNLEGKLETLTVTEEYNVTEEATDDESMSIHLNKDSVTNMTSEDNSSTNNSACEKLNNSNISVNNFSGIINKIDSFKNNVIDNVSCNTCKENDENNLNTNQDSIVTETSVIPDVSNPQIEIIEQVEMEVTTEEFVEIFVEKSNDLEEDSVKLKSEDFAALKVDDKNVRLDVTDYCKIESKVEEISEFKKFEELKLNEDDTNYLNTLNTILQSSYSENIKEECVASTEISESLRGLIIENENDAKTEEENHSCKKVIEDTSLLLKNTKNIKEPTKKPTRRYNKKVGFKKPNKKNIKKADIDKSVEKQTENNKGEKTSTEEAEGGIRRSSRIKTISVLKRKSKGHGLVKDKNLIKDKKIEGDQVDNTNSPLEFIRTTDIIPVSKVALPLGSPYIQTAINNEYKPVKVKSRWRRSSEMEMNTSSPSFGNNNIPAANTIHSVIEENSSSDASKNEESKKDEKTEEEIQFEKEMEERLKTFQSLTENVYCCERTICKEAKKMVCDCFLTDEEILRGELGCGEDCLNRLLMIECGSRCVVADRCTNKRFQRHEYATCKVVKTEKKGFGIQATRNMIQGDFIMEYVGEVLNTQQFQKRADEYSQDKNRHYYFMALKSDAIIDATRKGNVSRFINHSCDPNAETQKWTVNGELRIGFFSKREIIEGEEITFDYQFQRYGKEAQKCYCEASACRGWIGAEPEELETDEDEGNEDDDDEETEKEKSLDIEEAGNESVIKTDSSTETEHIKDEQSSKSSSDKLKVEVNKQLIKKESTKRKKAVRRTRKEIFEDLDLDEEIAILSKVGLKNQAQTLTLSRLMVRAKDISPRTKLLALIQLGELPCRRLFLDYHGLRLIYSWMCDSIKETKEVTDKEENKSINEHECLSFRVEILRTLQKLPISNKTMLQDSKVLPTVEKWRRECEQIGAPLKDINSPNSSSGSEVSTPILIDEATGLPVDGLLKSQKSSPVEDIHVDKVLESKDNDSKTNTEQKLNNDVNTTEKSELSKSLLDIANQLLENWKTLKEVFRIPKRERIEQMKEHEREANRGYMMCERDVKESSRFKMDPRSYRENDDRYRDRYRDRVTYSREDPALFGLSKFERRKLFAMKVAEEEKHKREKEKQHFYKVQQDLWIVHQNHCRNIGLDPILTACPHPTTGYPIFYNPQLCHWQPHPSINGPVFGLDGRPLNMSIPVSLETMRLQITSPLHIVPPPGIVQIIPQPVIPPAGLPHLNIPVINGYPRPNLNQSGVNCFQVPSPTPDRFKHSFNVELTSKNDYAESPTNIKPIPPHNTKHETSTLYVTTNGPRVPLPVGVKLIDGRIPPPETLPHNWRWAIDNQGRIYYYHIKKRIPQWLSPQLEKQIFDTGNINDSTSDSENRSSSESSSEESGSEDDMADTLLMRQVHGNISHFKESHSKRRRKRMDINEHSDDEFETQIDMDCRPENVIGYASTSNIFKTPERISSPILKHKRIQQLQKKDNLSPTNNSTSDNIVANISNIVNSPNVNNLININGLSPYLSQDMELPSPSPSGNVTPQPETEGLGFGSEVTQCDSPNSSILNVSPYQQTASSSSRKRRRDGLVQEIIISPRNEEDRLEQRQQMKKYKETKEKLRKKKLLKLQREKNKLIEKHVKLKAISDSLEKSPEKKSSDVPKKQLDSRSKKQRSSSKKRSKTVTVINVSKNSRIRQEDEVRESSSRSGDGTPVADMNSKSIHRIKEQFRSCMAKVIVGYLNAYRKQDVKQGRITNTEDFKHLARKLTHFVMVKEIKHCRNVEELTCNDSVKVKAREFIRKYMAKFGESYQRPADEMDD